jgi:hypothetical protein
MFTSVFTLELIINPFIFAGAVIAGVFMGYMFRKRKLAKMQSRILKLEEEMMNSHAEILEIQKAYVDMENNLIDQSSPVIPMKHSNKDSNKDNPKGKASR